MRKKGVGNSFLASFFSTGYKCVCVCFISVSGARFFVFAFLCVVEMKTKKEASLINSITLRKTVIICL